MRESDFAFANQVRAAVELRTPRTSRMLLAAALLLLITGTTWAHFAILDEVKRGQLLAVLRAQQAADQHDQHRPVALQRRQLPRGVRAVGQHEVGKAAAGGEVAVHRVSSCSARGAFAYWREKFWAAKSQFTRLAITAARWSGRRCW